MQCRAGDGFCGIEVGVDMHEANRSVGAQGLEDREGDRVVASDRYRDNIGRVQSLVECKDLVDHPPKVEGTRYRHVADVPHPAQAHRAYVGQRIEVEHIAGLRADLARSVTGTRSLGEAGVHRQADQGNVGLRQTTGVLGPKERGDTRIGLDVFVEVARGRRFDHALQGQHVHFRAPLAATFDGCAGIDMFRRGNAGLK